MPATQTKKTITAIHVDVVIANVVEITIAIINKLRAAVIGLGARSIDEDKRIIIDRTVVIIIYKFWG